LEEPPEPSSPFALSSTLGSSDPDGGLSLPQPGPPVSVGPGQAREQVVSVIGRRGADIREGGSGRTGRGEVTEGDDAEGFSLLHHR
jgi:hypothetical protein